MSSISLNGASPALYTLLSATTNNNPLVQDGSSISSTDGQAGATEFRNPFLAGSSFDGTPDANFFQSLQQSVAGALTSVQGNTAANPNQVIEQAITNALQQIGGGSTSDSDSNSDTSTNAGQSLSDTLQSYGISPQQFQTDFLSAVQQSQQGQTVDPSTVFSGFPTGLSVNLAG
jgi:hypothetical protein